MNKKVDLYLIDGCGRCKHYATPQCKVHKWGDELNALRQILLESELTEEVKWSMPCYTYKGKNVLILAAFKEYCSLNFFKGSLLKDPESLLSKAGENSEVGRLYKVTSMEDIEGKEGLIKDFIKEAIEIEKSGLKIAQKKKEDLDLPEELLQKFDEDPDYKSAFERLTPGRQRSYILHFMKTKQSTTRTSRIEKCKEKIISGKGFNEY